MFCAPGYGGVETARTLLAAGVRLEGELVRRCPLAVAMEHGRTHVVRLLLDAGADVTCRPGLEQFSSFMHVSMLRNQVTALRMILAEATARGVAVNVDVLADDGKPPIAWLQTSNVRALAVLLDCGANVHRYWHEPMILPAGEPQRMHAVCSVGHAVRCAPVLQLLLAHGLDESCPGMASTPVQPLSMAMGELQLAACNGNVITVAHAERCIKMLLKAGADPFALDFRGRTAVFHAVSCVSALLLRTVLQAARQWMVAQLNAATSPALTSSDRVSDSGKVSLAAAHAAFVRKLCERIPAVVTVRAPTGVVWSAASSRAVSFTVPVDERGKSVLDMALRKRAVAALPGYGSDEVLEVLLEAGAAACLAVDQASSCFVLQAGAALCLPLFVGMRVPEARTPAAMTVLRERVRFLELLRPHVPPAVWHTAVVSERGMTPLKALQQAIESLRQLSLACCPARAGAGAWAAADCRALLERLTALMHAILSTAGAAGGAA